MSEDRPMNNCDFCPECGLDCCTCPDDDKKHFPKCHKDFAKCNLCNCIVSDDPVTLTTTGGASISGTVAEVLCDCTVLRLAPGALIRPPVAPTVAGIPLTAGQSTFICCSDIETLVKESLTP